MSGPLRGALFAALALAILDGTGALAARSDPSHGAIQRDREMIKALVEGAIKLAAETDPVRRAGHCNAIAKSFGDEIGSAVQARELDRACELAGLFEGLLAQGVAVNLRLARQEAPVGSARESEMRELGFRVAELTGPIEELLNSAAGPGHDELQKVLRRVSQARLQVEKSLEAAESR
jgi:hypothetical protein